MSANTLHSIQIIEVIKNTLKFKKPKRDFALKYFTKKCVNYVDN
jgi:hypothetical protein